MLLVNLKNFYGKSIFSLQDYSEISIITIVVSIIIITEGKNKTKEGKYVTKIFSSSIVDQDRNQASCLPSTLLSKLARSL